MKPELKNQNLNSKSLIILFSIACYWFYLNFCLGYFLSKNFYNFFDTINKTDLPKIIEFRKKFSFKNIIKTVSEFFWKLILNWLKRIGQKFLLLMDAINKVIKALKISRKKFKSIFKFKHNFRLLKILLSIFWQTFLIYCSLVKEILFLPNLFYWLIEWGNFIRLLMNESVFITRIVYSLYLILLGIFGVLLGFLFGVFRREDDKIYVFLLLLLLQILYHNGFDGVLLEILRRRSLEPRNIEQFSNFSLKSIEQINPRPLKIALKEPGQGLHIPLPILIIEDPLVFIETEVLWEEPINYKFQLFKFYQNVNEKVKH